MLGTTVLERWSPRQHLSIHQLVDQHYDDVYRFCVRKVGEDSAYDLAQETFLEAQKSLSKFERRSSAKTWLFGIAFNQIRNFYKRNAEKELRIELRLESALAVKPELGAIHAVDLQRALDELSLEHREVVWLCVIEKLTMLEASTVLNIPQGTVKSRLHYAFAQLRSTLRPTETGATYP